MGGRGASSSIDGYYTNSKGERIKYGTEFKTILKDGNIKFVVATDNAQEELFETMTKGRVYVTVNKTGTLKSVIYFDNDNKRRKVINLDHKHQGMKPHTHRGYYHNEYDKVNGNKKLASNLTPKEKSMVKRVESLWKKYNK